MEHLRVPKLVPFAVRTLMMTVACGLCVFFLATAIVKIEPVFRRVPPSFDETAPVEGDLAPDFTLRDVDGEEFRLADHLGKRPVVIEFGSLSCPYCTRILAPLRDLVDSYGGRVTFVFIYCAEAHAAETPVVSTWQARRERASQLRRAIGDDIRILVDDFDDRSVQRLYKSLQNCAFGIGLDGRVTGKIARVEPHTFGPWLQTVLGPKHEQR